MGVVSSDNDDLGESNVSEIVSPGTRFKVKRGREENEVKLKKKINTRRKEIGWWMERLWGYLGFYSVFDF